jgi:hypothetical protein
MVAAGRDSLAERHPDVTAGDDGDPEDWAELLEAGHRDSPRRAERLLGAYARFLAGAIEAAGALCDAERDGDEAAAATRAAQLYSALTAALGELLAYVRLVCADQARLV